MIFDKFIYIWPPRTNSNIPFKSDSFEKLKITPGWKAEFKLNGQRSLFYFHPDGKLELWNRHKEHHKNFVMPEWLQDDLRSKIDIKPGVFTVFDGEILHAKDSTVKNTFYIWDVLVHNGDYLIGKKLTDRRMLLNNIFRLGEITTPDNYAIKLSENVWLSYPIEPDLWDNKWDLTNISFIEGFVLKDYNYKLSFGTKEGNNSAMMVRCRKLSSSGHVGRFG